MIIQSLTLLVIVASVAVMMVLAGALWVMVSRWRCDRDLHRLNTESAVYKRIASEFEWKTRVFKHNNKE